MSWVAAATVTAAVVGSRAAGKAASAQRDAASQANETQLQMFEQTREDMQPWREAGTVALRQLVDGTAAGGDLNRDFTLQDFQRDPGYDFRMREGMRGLEGSAAARGGLMSGGTLKALQRYGQDYASAEFSNAYNRFNADRDRRFNRLAGIAGVGQTATRDVAGFGANAANAVAGNQLAAGNATAAGYVGRANAFNNSLGNLQSMYTLSRMFPNGTAQPRSYAGGMTGFFGGNGTSGD